MIKKRKHAKTGDFESSVVFDDQTFRLSQEFVGLVQPFEFHGLRYKICFPTFDSNDRDGFDRPKVSYDNTPVKLDWLKRKDSQYKHGSEHMRDNNGIVLGFNCTIMVIISTRSITKMQAKVYAKELSVWRDLFPKWLELVTYTDLEQSSMNVQQDNRIEPYISFNSKPEPLARNGNGAIIRVTMLSDISLKDFKKALRLAKVGEKPPIYYTLLLKSLRYFNQENYRYCILDAATAFEMALTQILDNKIKNMSQREKKLINNKYRQIMGLYEALSGLAVILPTKNDVQTKIAEPRNRAIHRGVDITMDEAKSALIFVKDFIYLKLSIR